MAAPSIPPRPSRSQNMPVAAASIDLPQVPARPRRSVERSVSPHRDRFAPSPLNNPGYLHTVPSIDKASSGLSREVPIRPSSVTLPSVGQEGTEYDHATPVLEQFGADPLETATSNTAEGLPLHAPKASLPVAAAKQRIAAVTRTDSGQAAALGIGKAHSNASETDLGLELDRSSSRQSQTRSRPPSLYKQDTNDLEEQGIPSIGLQVPMYPNAGDVQAPTPSPGMVTPSQGTGSFNNGGQSTPRNHSRTKSGREVFHGPPGSYGLRGHGVNKADPFEKAWYDRHPEALAREQKGEYGPAISHERKEWALSSDELNKLVHTTSHTAIGASPVVVGTPGEAVGYIASDEYTQRMASRPPSTKPRRPSSQTFTESPLRKMSLPADALEGAVEQTDHPKNDQALESETEDDTIHVDIPRSPYTAAAGMSVQNHVQSEEDLPILAPDEFHRRPDAQWLQPAVEPEFERRNSSYLDLSESTSRPHSRSGSINKISENHLSHIASRGEQSRPDSVGTPLDDVKEYEPLFDEDEPRSSTALAASGSPQEKSQAARPDLARHQFPSRDVWEDAPDSVHYVTTVDGPQEPEERNPAAEHEPKGVYEPPESEAARKNVDKNDQENFLPDQTKRLAKQRFNPDVMGQIPTRPGIQHRFPSQDIWEDTPSSHLYTTTIDPEEEQVTSPADAEQPQIPTKPAKKASDPMQAEARPLPVVPGRPKPSVPARPSRLRGSDASEEAPLSKSLSKDSNEGASVSKVKPAVPSRPGGSSKIAALQAGFMSDLNKKLGLGPQASKKEEPKEEEEEAAAKRAPLADARKGRARGPQRRKPGVSPGGAGEEAGAAPSPAPSRPIFKFTISRPQTIWEVDEGILSVPVSAPTPETAQAVAEAARIGAPAEIQISSDGKLADEAASAPTAPETSSERTDTKDSVPRADTAVQTGENTMETTNPETGDVSRATAFVGGHAPEEGDVVKTEDGREHISSSS